MSDLPTLPILTCAATRLLEERLLGDDPARAWAAMSAAGTALAGALALDYQEYRPWPESPRLLLLAGSGHNAGDAFLAARELLRLRPGARLHAVLVFGGDRLKPLARRALEELRAAAGPSLTVSHWPDVPPAGAEAAAWDVLLDGLLGYQCQPPLRPPAAEAIRWANGLTVRVRAAVDLPSGLGDETAEEMIEADFTYATGVLKSPCLEHSRSRSTGRLRALDLGFFAGAPEEGDASAGSGAVLTAAALDPLRQLRPAACDKRSFGHLFVMGGSPFMPGAISMALQGAVRSGAGLVTGLVPMPLAGRLIGTLPEAMWMPLPVLRDDTLAPDCLNVIRLNMERAQAMVLGPGLDTDKASRVLIARIVREIPLPMVLDAGALQPDVMYAVIGRPADAGPVIITPHLGEYGRLLRQEKPHYDQAQFLEFCAKHRLVAVLKGSVTRISDGRRLLHSLAGSPVLARGGSGDILAGLIGGLLAQDPSDPLGAAARGALWHGLAAESLARAHGQHAVRTTDLLDHLSPSLRGPAPLP